MQVRRFIGIITLGVLVLLGVCDSASGTGVPTNAELMNQLKEMRGIIEAQNARIGELENQVRIHHEAADKERQQLNEKMKQLSARGVSAKRQREIERLGGMAFQGLDIGAGVTMVAQGTPNANNADNAPNGNNNKGRFDGSYSADIEIAKAFDDWGQAFLHLEAGQGDTIESELAVFSNVNRDAGDSGNAVEVTEAWYEHYLFDDQATITVGKIDATAYIDTNEFANDETTQFLGHIFRNSAVIDWPNDNAWGGRVYLSPDIFNGAVDVDTVFMNAAADWEGLVDNPFVATQINFQPHEVFGWDPEQWGGNYRVLMWYNGLPHARVKNPDEFARGNVGFGISIDQRITDVYGVFGRFGYADPRKSDLEYDWSVGAQMDGRYWNREDDVLGIAIGQAIPGSDYKDTHQFTSAETHFEAYYAYKLNQHMTVSPDIQVIWDPNGGGVPGQGKDNDTIFVYGFRSQIDF